MIRTRASEDIDFFHTLMIGNVSHRLLSGSIFHSSVIYESNKWGHWLFQTLIITTSSRIEDKSRIIIQPSMNYGQIFQLFHGFPQHFEAFSRLFWTSFKFFCIFWIFFHFFFAIFWFLSYFFSTFFNFFALFSIFLHFFSIFLFLHFFSTFQHFFPIFLHFFSTFLHL